MIPDRIVVPLDGSEFATRALPVARALVRQTGGELILVRACEDDDVATARTYLDDLAAAHPDIDVSTVVIDDRAAPDAIRDIVGAAPGRIACMTTHGRGRMRWALLGSTAETVVRQSSGSVLLAGRHCRPTWANNYRRMVMTVAGSTEPSAVEREAVDWAKTLGLDVHVVTVVHPLDSLAGDAGVDAILARMESERVRAHAHVLHGAYAAPAIAGFAESVDADLIAMSSHARTGVARVALGSVTMEVVGLARGAVLVQRTAGVVREDVKA